MKRKSTRAAALETLGIRKADAAAIIEIAARLQKLNQDAWDGEGYWHVITDDDGKQSFWLSDDGTEETARPRHEDPYERQQILSLRVILRRYPWLAFVHQPSPNMPAIALVRAPRDGEAVEPDGIIIRAYVSPPDDYDNILG